MSGLYKGNASLNCFSFVNPALIPPLYSDTILSPLRLPGHVFFFLPLSILDSSEFACGSLTFASEVGDLLQLPSDNRTSAGVLHGLIDIRLPLSVISCCVSTSKPVWSSMLVSDPSLLVCMRPQISVVAHRTNKEVEKSTGQVYKDRKYEHSDSEV